MDWVLVDGHWVLVDWVLVDVDGLGSSRRTMDRVLWVLVDGLGSSRWTGF